MISSKTINFKNYHVYLLTGIIIILTSLTMQTATAADIYVNGTGDDITGTGTIINPYKTINWGIINAASGDTINLNAGNFSTYTDANHKDYNITISKNINIKGVSTDETVINPAGNGRAFTITAGYTVTLSNLTIMNGNADGTAPSNQGGAILNNGVLTVTNVDFTNNTATDGGAILTFGTLTVNKCTFTSNIASDDGGAICNGHDSDVPTGNVNIANSTFTNNRGVYATIWNYGPMNVANSTFTNNNGTYGGVFRNWGTLTITGNSFTNNIGTNNGGVISNRQGTVTANFNRIIGNGANDIRAENNGATSTVNAENNWWGSNAGPSTGRVTAATGATVDYNPWLILTVSASPSPIYVGNNSTVTADLSYNSNGVIPASTTGYRLPVTLISFTTTDLPALGTLNPASANTSSLINPIAISTFTAASPGTTHITVTVDNQSTSTTVRIISAVLVVRNELYSQLEGQTPKYASEDYYYIHVKNNGPDTARNVVLTDTVSSALNIIEWWVSWDNQITYLKNDSSFNPATGIWDIGDLVNGKEVFLDIRMLISQTGTIINTATAAADNTLDASDAFTINVPTPTGNINLQITNSFSNTNPAPGSTNTFTITINNPSNSAASGIVVTDGMPSEITITSWRTRTNTETWTNNDPTYDWWTGVWNLGNLARRTSKTIQITFTVPESTGTTDVISTVYGNQNDGTLSNNYDKASFTVAGALMAIEEPAFLMTESEQPLQTTQALTDFIVETNSQPDTISSQEDNQSITVLSSQNPLVSGISGLIENFTNSTETEDTGITGIITSFILSLLGTVSSITVTLLGALLGIPWQVN